LRCCGLSRMQDPSLSQSRPRGRCLLGTFSMTMNIAVKIVPLDSH
jgi:hypothetical protein